MPEIAEVAGFADVVNKQAARVFIKCSKSAVHKLDAVEVPFNRFRVRAAARGKECILTMEDEADAKQQIHVRFGFGMTGSFKYFKAGKAVHKHAHFLMEDTDGGTLAFVDSRRFGSWTVVKSATSWNPDRGPCPLREFDAFALHVATKIRASKWWNKPICETLLDQGLFNGVGNYVRAEVMHEAGIEDPFRKTCLVLADLTEENCRDNLLLKLCKTVAERFLDKTYMTFTNKLKVYGKSKSLKRKDSNGRMVWWLGSGSGSSVTVAADEEVDEKPKKSKAKKAKKAAPSKRRSASEPAAIERSATIVLNEEGEEVSPVEPPKRKRKVATEKKPATAKKATAAAKKTQQKTKKKTTTRTTATTATTRTSRRAKGQTPAETAVN